MVAFTFAVAAWLNEPWCYLCKSPVWLNRYTEYATVLIFVLWHREADAEFLSWTCSSNRYHSPSVTNE